MLFLQLGSNMGDRECYLARARAYCDARIGRILNQSSIYQTAPWGVTDQQDYLNQVIQIATDKPARQCLDISRAIEDELGRTRSQRWGPRTIDLDLLLYGDQIIESPDLILPHPRMAVRRFVLVPLCELAPTMRHPLLRRSVRAMLTACSDDGKVLRYLRF